MDSTNPSLDARDETRTSGRMPCLFPSFGRRPNAGNSRKVSSTRVNFDHADTLVSLLAIDPDGLGALLRTAWALLLRCYTGQDDVSFGFQLIGDGPGYSISTRLCLDDSASVSQMLSHARAELARDPNPASGAQPGSRDSGRLFDTAVVLWIFTQQSAPFQVPVPQPPQQSLQLLAKRTAATLNLFLEWDGSRLGMSPSQGALVASTLAEILSGLLTCSQDAPLSSLVTLSQANLDQVCQWNDELSLQPVERCIHDVVADQVLSRPDAEAVCAWDGVLTYRELDAVADGLAATLMGFGVGPEILVPLCFEKSKWTIVAMLAVLKAGGAFVPLDPSHPSERIRGLCHSVGAKLILCSSHLVQTLAGVVDQVLAVDESVVAGSPRTVATTPTTPTNAAYVIFTSGSTGQPKGTVIEHRAFCSSARSHAPALRIDGTCRVLQFAAYTFDASLVEILTPLMVGACVCIPSEHERLNDLAAAMNRMQVDHAVLTPSFINFLAPAAVPGLRRLVLAGEAMSRSHVATWSHIELVNGYGPAESSVAAVVNSMVGRETEPTDIGTPCGVRVWIVDPTDHHQLLPVGCVGEMLLEGPSLARGYLNNTDQTAASFIPAPSWAGRALDQGDVKRRFYKTGDLARYNSSSGFLTYVGRKDTQIKLHGQRIELGEIEHHLAVDDDVEHAMVLLPKQGPLAKRLVTVLTLDSSPTSHAPSSPNGSPSGKGVMQLTRHRAGAEPVLARIRARLDQSLPPYMVPSTWLCVQAIPMLPSRKMDRKTVMTWVESVLDAETCQEMIRGHAASMPAVLAVDDDHVKPAALTDIETKLRDIWSLVLNFPANDILPDGQSFLSLGGDSISAMTCASYAKKAGLEVSMQAILKAKSLRLLAVVTKQIVESVNQGDGGQETDVERIEIPFELTPIQQLHMAVRGDASHDGLHFNQSFCLRLSRRVEPAAVREAIRSVVTRHAMLRSRFVEGETGQWQQYITDDVDTSYRFRGQTISSRAKADADIASAQACLDVRKGPLLAGELFAVQDSGQQILFLTAHHLVVDLVSWRMILEEMEEHLANPSTGVASQRSVSFREWANLQAEHSITMTLTDVLPSAAQVPEAQFSYWGMDDQPNLYGDVACEGFDLDLATTTTLLSDCHVPFRTETVDLLISALIWSFRGTFSDRLPPAVFNEGHGREPPSDEIDISRTVGWFTTLTPIALDSPSTFAEALIQTKDLRQRIPGNGRPYFAARFHNSEGRECWGMSHKHMEVSFNFLGRYQQLEREGGLFQPAEGALMAGEAHPGNPTADFGCSTPRFSLFEISAVIVQGVLRFGFAWNQHMVHQDRIHAWVAACRGALAEAAVTLPKLARRMTLGDLKLLPELTADDLDTFEETRLHHQLTGGRGWEAVEDIYPASPIQQGLLLSRTKDEGFYAVRRAFYVNPNRGRDMIVDVTRLVGAWKQVVHHHALLRTVFVDAISQARAGSYDQVVLHDLEPPMTVRECPGGEAEIRRLVDTMQSAEYQDEEAQHHLSILYCGTCVVGVLEMSHAIMDGASMDILLRDFGRAYEGSLATVAKPLFSPFVGSLQQRSPDEDMAFWAGHLAGVEPCRFPILNDGVAVPDSERALRTLRVQVPGLAGLQKFCNETGFTLPNALHAAWALTLACYTGTDEVCFGYLVSGRDSAPVDGSEDAVGPFINMATQRVRLSCDEENQLTLLQVLEAVQHDQIESMPYAQASLAEVQHALDLPGGMALFDTCVSYRRRPQQTTTDETSIVFEDLGPIHDPTEYPISLNIEMDDQQGAVIDLDYWTDAVASPQANHIAATFLQVLSKLSERPDTPISQLDFVHPTSKEQIWAWNAHMPPTTSECVHRMVERQVALRPKAQAIRGWDADFSYEEMDSLANRLAIHLADFGVGPETFVPVCFDKSAWTTIAMLAVLKAGGAVVPLDATHPADALEGKVVDSGSHVVVASSARAMLFEPMVPYVIAIGPELMAQLPAVRYQREIKSGVTPENAAFVMFTSGSTGKPKGVVLCHDALVSSALAHGSALEFGPHSRVLQFAAHTFDNSLEEMFTTLIHGGCVCVPSDEDRLGDLPGAIDRLDANFMDLTPTVAALVRPEQVPKIRGIAVGGEALTQEVLDIWGGAVPVHNQYGPSECSINATHKLHLSKDGDTHSIGTSVGSVSWVVNPANHNLLVPIGCVGELLIEGPILARGYLGRPVETAKVFIEMPAWAALDPRHGARGSRRMYKTGDLVRYNSDGSLVYLGRKDTQVKLHGQRIELGEIEHHVKAGLPSAARSCVELVTAGQSKALAMFFCMPPFGNEDAIRILPITPDIHSLSQSVVGAMAAKVAAYMVPSLLFPVSKMPVTSSGKLDRRRLRYLVGELADNVAGYRLASETAGGRAPETPTEKQLHELWASVLNVDADAISADDSFFSHGGDSVGAMRLVAAARRAGVALTVANVFQAPRLVDMANTATVHGSEHGGKSGNSSASTVVEEDPLPGPVEPFSLLGDKAAMGLDKLRQHVASICRVDVASIEDICPCTPLQAGLVAASQRRPGAYVAVSRYELPDGIDLPRFKAAWQEVVDSESILRTRVVFVEGIGFLQVVVQGRIPWATVGGIDELSTAEHRHLPPHDGGVLSRYSIIGENNNRPTFAWTAHHAIYDGWSLPTLLDRVESRYRHPQIPRTQTPHYSRFVEHLSTLNPSASDAFWTAKVSEPGTVHFPQLPHPGYRVQATSQASRMMHFMRPKGAVLATASFLRAAWALVVSIYSSSDDIVFGEILNGRDVPVPGIEDLVGPTLASVPRRVRIDRSVTVKQMLSDVHAQLGDVSPHQFAGLQRIRSLSPAAAATCDFQNLLAIDMAEEVPEDSLWAKMNSDGSGQGPDFFSYPLNVTCTLGRNNDSDGIQVQATFDDKVVPRWQVVRMLGQFETVLSRLSAAECQRQKVGDVDLLTPDDKAAVREWNKTPGPLVERRVHDMICDTMASNGGSATAVVGWDATLTNGELDALSTALAGELVSNGAGADNCRFVPFCFEKSTFAVVAMLAVLKAGAAFVPLDPAHPVARLKEIVRDCAATVVLCSPKYQSLCAGVVKTVLPVDAAMLEELKAAPSMSSRRLSACQPSDPAYAIFTSGTTGKPKGTIVSHTAFCSGAAAHGPAMLMTPPFRFLQFASFTFDASLVEILTTLIMGGTVCVPREEDRTNGRIAAAMEEMGVTMTLLTPSFARVIDPASVPHLETLILGGEAMDQSHLSTWANRVKLVNAYGPSECAVVATVNPRMSLSSNPANLGRGLGRCWVVDRQNHDRLAPLGSVGELLVEGPTLATGYLNNEEKTRESFIENPSWILDPALRYPDTTSREPRRLYKTGDLVRVCDDVTGEMAYMGRKDASQAKLNGQRLELDEVAHHLTADDAIQHAAVVLPKTGPCVQRLVAVLSLRGSTNDQRGPNKFKLVTSPSSRAVLVEIQDRLRAKLPAYMVPSTWIVLQAIPLLPSGKLDRKSVAGFVDTLNDDTIDKMSAIAAANHPHDGEGASAHSLSVEERLKSIWCQALNISPERVRRDVSFLHLGGDSITAMQVMAKARGQGIHIAVPDIISSNSVHDLALKATSSTELQRLASRRPGNEDHHEFDLAPIQQLYFHFMHTDAQIEATTKPRQQFNQSMLLRVAKNISPSDLGHGLHALVDAHSMLRARFRRDATGGWRQRITSDISGSYRFKTHIVGAAARMEKRIQNSQRALDVENGPLVAADWFAVGKEKSEAYVFITVHHLVVDVVSWGILLQDLEDFLSTKSIKTPPSLSFQAWTRGQSEQAQEENHGPRLLPHREASDTDLEYWGMTNNSNVHGDVVVAGNIELDKDASARLLGPECHAPLQTEVLDVLLAALLLSYRSASSGRRGLPTIHVEGHGREPWDTSVDLSRTVGWFTTLCPVHLPSEASSDDDFFGALRWIREYRKRLRGKGRPYFAYQVLTARGRDEYGHHWPVEVAFNYLGQMQQLSRPDAILQPFDGGVGQGMNTSSDIGPDVPRLALVEVSALVVGGKLKISFSSNKHMKNQESLQRWISECATILREAPRRLSQHTPEKTFGPFPLLPLSYYGLENLEQRLSEVGVLPGDVEDVYPCSSMQRGLLLSQIRDPEKYGYRAIFRVNTPGSEGVDLERLSNAWQTVIRRHSVLRTTFVDTVGDEGLMDQVVLRKFSGRIQALNSESDDDALRALQTMDRVNYNEKQPPHRLSLCRTSQGRVFCSLEVSHAICDGSSVPILLDDLIEAYGTGTVSKPVPFYRDYIAHMQSQSPTESSRYWKEYLKGAEPCLFPSLTDGEEHGKSSLQSHAITLSNTARINEYCRSSGITLSTLLQFVWALVVRSYTGSDDVMFGYLSSGRDVPVEHIGHAVGVFINMLVCRLQLTANTEVGDALDTMRADLANAMSYQNCSLAEIQHELQLPGAALFNTAFTYQKRSEVGQRHSGSEPALRFDVVSAEDPSEYAVAVNVEATDNKVEVHFGYWRNMVSDAQIRNISDTFEQALGDLIADGTDDRTVGELQLVGPAAFEKIRSWNDFELPHVEKCVHDLVKKHALQRPPSTPAVCGWDASFTYLELDRAAAALAHQLVADDGVGPELFVPLCFEKSAWTVVAQLAVLKAGGAFVNLDPSHPDARLRDLIAEVDAKVVLCSAAHKAKMNTIAENVFVVDDQSIKALIKSPTASPDATRLLAPLVKPSDPAYIIFTSGTTGKPKGTVIEHAAFCTGAVAHAKAMFMLPDSRVLQFASYTFDASIMETLSCLLVGGCVCVPSDEQRMNDVGAVIRDMGVTWTLLTPSVASTVKPESVPCLKTLVTGGEAMAAGHVSRWGTQCALVNAYGPTECSVVATTSTKVDESRQVCNTDRSNIGTAVGGRVWVVDPQNPDRLVPVGAVGELVVEGRLVARGYLNNKEQTDKVFIQSPRWALESGFPESMWHHRDRMYRTGDLVRYNSDGSIAYIARKDTQVKLNGRRIELGEVEFHCRAGLPDGARAVVEVVASQRKSRVTTKSLAVFLSLPTDEAPSSFSLLPLRDPHRKLALNLENHLSRHLPAYMAPQLFVPVSTMPWTSAGKLDRKRLRQALEEVNQQVAAGYRLSAAATIRRGPASETEKKLQGLWETVLGLAPGSVGVGDSFFRLGGDSLTAMRLVGAARAHKIALTVLDVFEKPVLSDMARACGDGGDASASVPSKLEPFELLSCPEGQLESLLQEVSAQCQLPHDRIRDVYPCSPLQEGLVTLASKQAGAYVAVNTLRLPEHVNLDRFKAAWQRVVDETDILRTRIVHTTASGFLQVVAATESIHWHENLSLAEAVAKGQALGQQNGGALTRYMIAEGHEDGHGERLFVWALHHALYDGWSLRLIASRVQETYNSQSESPNTVAAAPFANFIHYLQQRDQAASEKFWANSLSGAATSVAHFPPLPSTLMAQGDTPTFQAETRVVKLQRSNLSIDVTLPTLVRAAWAIVLASYTGMDDVVFGETLAGRNVDVAGVSEMAGPTFATIPARVRLDHGMRLGQFLQDMHAMAGQTVPHQHMGLQHIKRLDPDCAAACEFQNLLVIQMANSSSSPRNRSEPEQQGNELDWGFQGGSSADSFFTHPLVLECTVADPAIEATFHYNTKVLSSWHTKRLAHQFEAVLTQLVDKSGNNDVCLGDVHVISPEDQVLLGRWNRKTPSKIESCVHALFQEQASSDPQRPAIVAWDANFTYSQLHEYASRLAHRLTQLGVKRQRLVPVCLERSAWSVVILMGILMAGGAFVPLDPAQPLARHQDILESVRADLIICSPEYESHFSAMADRVVAIDGNVLRELRAASHAEPRAPLLTNSTDTAYVLFTSGSTGRPKGVVVAHRDFCSSSRAYADATHMDSSSRVFHFASLTFDAAVLEVLTPLTLGACVCVPTAHDRLHDLGNSMARLRATWSLLTPSVANMLDPGTVPALKTLVCGGEAMLSETVSRWANHVELMNAYGPTEASVVAAVNPLVSVERNPAVIGRGTAASRLWVVEPREGRNDRLAPVGAVGELAISGPLLARGYLNEPEKTAQAFIENPGWATKDRLTRVTPPARIYRTGDLVRYRPDGTLEFVGRRDGQVKVNGQRIELGEIESRLSADKNVRLALVVQPKAGPGKKKLIAVLTLASTTSTVDAAEAAESAAAGHGDCKPLDGPAEQLAQARAELAEIQAHLEDTLPHHMIPTAWFALRAMPVMVSGKLDRRRVTGWVESLDDADYETFAGGLGHSSGEDNTGGGQVEGLAKTLREIWAEELSLPVDRIKLHQPFLALGGDSIRAMGVISRARNANIKLTIQDVLRSKSVVHLAQLAQPSMKHPLTATEATEAETEQPFALSPIQAMYLKASDSHSGDARFNQSITLEIPRRVPINTIKQAIDCLVTRHGMLRARFSRGEDGSWEQQISKIGPSAYQLVEHRLQSSGDTAPIIAEAQAGLCIERGPVFRVDLFDVAGHGQTILSMVAHHLCIDMVSWRVIMQDLTQLLETGSMGAEQPLSFRSWCSLNSTCNKGADLEQLLPFKESPTNLAYWGGHRASTYGRTAVETFTLDEQTTKLALGDCHRALRSEPVELFLAAVSHSFATIFPDRHAPTIHLESHGRESPEGSNIDLSRTVGWFTTICPLVIPVNVRDSDVLDTLRRTKDLRRSIKEHGRPYFAHKHLGSADNTGWRPMEILFNYLGGGVGPRHRKQAEAAAQQVELAGGDDPSIADVGPKTRRLALFEISAIVLDNKLQFSFVYDSGLSRLDDIHKWINTCKTILEETARTIPHRPAQPTLSDYPLLPITYDGLRTLTEVTLPQAGIDLASCFAQVEDIYPCTPVQEGMLISQLRNPRAYMFHAVYDIKHPDPRQRLDVERLASAWQRVVDRHAALRTIFIESVRRGAVFDQVVLKKTYSITVLRKHGDEEAMDALRLVSLEPKKPQPSHQLTICPTDTGRVLMKLEVNHAALDGGSLAIILEELSSGYMGNLQGTTGPLFSNYVQYIRALPGGEDIEHWKRYLEGVKPSYFPTSQSSTTTLVNDSTRTQRSAALKFGRFSELRQLSERAHATLASIMHAAWALVLRRYTGRDDVCFGYLMAGRDVPVEGIDRTVGPLINMLCCRLHVSKSRTLQDIVQTAQDHHLQSIPHQHCSLAQVQHELGLAGKPLYNTSISTQNLQQQDDAGETLSFDMEAGHDPSEYAITVNIETSRSSEGVVFRYWSDEVSDHQAQEVASSMARILEAIIDQPTQSVDDLDHALSSKPYAAVDAEDVATATENTHEKPHSEPRNASGSSIRTSSDASWQTPTSGPTIHTPLEQTLLALWSSMLGLAEDSINPEDSFFDLGGDSITAMKLAGEARDFGLPLTVADVFRKPTFIEMAASVRAATDIVEHKSSTGNTGTSTPQSIKSDLYERFSLLAASNVDAFLQNRIVPHVCVFRGGILDVLPATDFQSLSVAGALLESRWMLNYFCLDGDGPLNLVQLKRACFRVVQALDILRTVFVPSGGRFLQVVLRTLRPAFHVVETDLPLDEYPVGDEGSEPRLGEPFVEFTVVKHRSSLQHRLFLRISHAQYDGVCFPKILDALQAAYKGETVPRPPSFANYLRASAGSLTSEHYQHWKKLLAGSSMTEVVRRPGPNYHSHATGATTACLKKTVQLPPVEFGHITTATVVKAAWAYVLAQVSAKDDVVFGHTISGRNAEVEGIGNMVGPCLNLVPVRVQFGSGRGGTVQELLRQVQDQQVSNMAHEVLGFREIIRHCTNWPRWTYFTSTVQHQNVEQRGSVRLGDVNYRVGCASAAQEDFSDLSVLSQPLETDGAYEIMLSFTDGGAIPHDFAEHLLAMLCDAAHLFATDPNAILPSAAELRSKQRQIPFEEIEEISSDQVLTDTAHLEHLNPDQLLELSTLVRTAWLQALGLSDEQQSTNEANITTNSGTVTIDLDTSFFSLGGDMTGLAQLVWLLDQRGFTAPPRLEELVENHTVRGHMALLARGITPPPAPAAVPDESGAGELKKAATFPMVGEASQKKLAKALGMVRRRLGKKKGAGVVAVA